MKSNPRRLSAIPVATSGTSRPRAFLCLRAAATTRSMAPVKVLEPKSPGTPRETERSKWPTQRQSTPGVAAIASAFFTPPAVGRVFQAIDDVARLLRGAHHGQHHALCPHIRRARDMVVLLRGHAHDGRKIRRLEIAQRALHGLEAEAGMLQIEE